MTITDVPNHRELSETGFNWLNLAWETAIDRVKFYLEHLEYHELSNDSKPMPARKQKAYWHANRFKLNNAIAILQQALEILLKARIAKISPYLLMSGPVSRHDGSLSFLDFKTLDAKELVRVVQIVSEPLPDGFQTFFDDLRKRRNRISHLNAGNFRVEARSILIDIMCAHRFLFPDKDWLSVRRSHIETAVAPLVERLR